MKKILVLLSFTLLAFAGCTQQTTFVREENPLPVSFEPQLLPFEAEVVGYFTLKTEKPCNSADFLFYVRKEHNAHRVFDVVMKQTDLGYDSIKCEYSGIGVRYKFNDVNTEQTAVSKNISTEQKAKIKVKLDSNPRGATILVNGKEMNNPTPNVLNFIPGKYNIRFKAAYLEKDTTIVLREGQEDIEINMSLE